MRRHHLCRPRRPTRRPGQRDQLLQQQRHRLRRRLHHHDARLGPGQRLVDQRRRDAVLVLWPEQERQPARLRRLAARHVRRVVDPAVRSDSREGFFIYLF